MSPTSKADRLRSRLSINPDEPPPAAGTPASTAVTPRATGAANHAPAELAESAPAGDDAPASRAETPAPPRSTTAARSGQSRVRRDTAAPTPTTALEDPGITPGRKDYRSFYIEDATFARFRAAIYWLSRREDAADEVPENMSVAVETWMADTAESLERRFNGGEVFRMPPASKRRRRH